MTDSETPWTVARVLSWAADDFRARGFDSPRLDAELLLARVLKCDRVRLIMDAARPLAVEELAAYRSLIQRRRRHEPVAYILGEREFYGLGFRIDQRVLVPRPDTETLVETALERSAAIDQFGQALDLCTGSGCVAIAFAQKRPTWRVWASDVSEAALCVARDNALRLGVPQITFRRSDLFEAFNDSGPWNLITANPPYIPHADIAELDPDVRDHEPHLALDGGSDGLEIVRRLVPDAAARLAPDGVLAIEIGADQAPAVRPIFEAAGLVEVRTDLDYGSRDRVVSGLKPRNDGSGTG